MGKASSNKKVQKAANAGGASGVDKPKLGFPILVGAVIVSGIALVAFARVSVDTADSGGPALSDHWHAAYGIWGCDSFRPPVDDAFEDHGDGIHSDGPLAAMHIHPTTSNATGDHGVLGVWAEQTAVEFTDDSLTLPSGEKFTNGDDCNGTPGEVVVARWNDAQTVDSQGPDLVLRSDFGSLRYEKDQEAILIAFLPEGTAESDFPKPDISELANLGGPSPDAPDPTGTDVPASTVSVPGDSTAPGSTPATTLPGGTTAPGSTPTTAISPSSPPATAAPTTAVPTTAVPASTTTS